VLCDYRGGIYVTQVTAASPTGAAAKWAISKDVPPLKKLKPAQRQEIVNALLTDDVPVPLDGIKNVWCFCPTIMRHSATVNLVLTEARSVFETRKV
jgi:hypothetical protein